MPSCCWFPWLAVLWQLLWGRGVLLPERACSHGAVGAVQSRACGCVGPGLGRAGAAAGGQRGPARGGCAVCATLYFGEGAVDEVRVLVRGLFAFRDGSANRAEAGVVLVMALVWLTGVAWVSTTMER